MSASDPAFEARSVNGAQHYRQAKETAEQNEALLMGIIIGMVAGLLWERLR